MPDRQEWTYLCVFVAVTFLMFRPCDSVNDDVWEEMNAVAEVILIHRLTPYPTHTHCHWLSVQHRHQQLHWRHWHRAAVRAPVTTATVTIATASHSNSSICCLNLTATFHCTRMVHYAITINVMWRHLDRSHDNWLTQLRYTLDKAGHFRDALFSESHGLYLEIQHNKTTQQHDNII